MSSARRILFRVAAIVLSILIILAILEIIAYLALHKKWPRKPPIPTNEWVVMTGRGRRLKPNLDFTQWFVVSNRVIHFQTNSLGFRGREIALKKTPGVSRILILGDSITLSAFLPENEVYPALVEKILSRTQPVQVINGGVFDVGLKEEIYLLKDPGLKLDPDLAVIGFYLNDSRPPWGFENEYYRLPPWLTQLSKTIEQYSYLYKWIWKRFLVSHFLGPNAAARLDWREDYLKGDWRTDKAAYQKVIQEASMDFGAAWQEDSWKTIYSGLDELQSLARKNRFKLAVLIFPVGIQVKSEAADDYPQQKMKNYCAQTQIPCLDLLPVLREHKAEDIYFDHCHLNTLGHRIIAPSIAGFLENSGLLPAASGQK